MIPHRQSSSRRHRPGERSEKRDRDKRREPEDEFERSAGTTRGIRERRRKREPQLSSHLDKYLLAFALAIVCGRVLTILYPGYISAFTITNTDEISPHPRDVAVSRNLRHRLQTLSVEIFSAPKPFLGTDNELNRRAIESWLRLSPKPKITLLGNDIGYAEAALEYGLEIETRVDKTFLGVPLFNSMIELANKSDATIAVVINGDILLTDDFMKSVKKIVSSVKDFLLVAARFDVDSIPSMETGRLDHLRQHVVETGKLHTYGGMDLWAWNPRGPRLFGPQMPHFIFGRGKYDNWMTHEAIAAGNREVIDGSETCLLIHVRHDYHLVHGNEGERVDPEASSDAPGRKLLNKQFWSEGKRSKFELFINIYLSLQIGTYVNQMGSVLYAPWKLGRCAERGGMCFTRRMRPGMCPCEYSGFTSATQTDPSVKPGSRVIRCGQLSSETKKSFVIPVLPDSNDKVEPESFGMPLTIRTISEKVAANNTIILTALTFGYRDMMMNWVCNMRELGISNYVVAALDQPLYEYAFTRSLPTYFENTIPSTGDSGARAGASYGSSSFKRITKAKSRVVLRLLKLGYHVHWSDCDIIFFKNPLSYMWNQNADLVIQTNAPDGEDLNGVRRLNSGFYLARSTPALIEAFEQIVEYARRSTMSEQPCFYDVLCGKKGEKAVGKNGCKHNDVLVKVLPRKLFPNGITMNIWNVEGGRIPDNVS